MGTTNAFEAYRKKKKTIAFEMCAFSELKYFQGLQLM